MSAPDTAATIRAMADWLATLIDHQRDLMRVPGAQVAIRYRGELLTSFGCGVANAETGEELTTEHLFHIASHSKTFTATALFQLLEAGKLRLDDPAAQWLPELDGSPAAELTIRELMGHQSGINRDSDAADFWQLLADFPDRDGLLAMARADAILAPNEHFKYSNVGYSLLGQIVAAASGETYEDYVMGHIVQPLGLAHTGPEMTPALEPRATSGHAARLSGDDPARVMGTTYSRAMAAATGFYGTAEDVTAYLSAHRLGDDRLISDRSKRLMQRRESHLTKGGERWYGLGMSIAEIGERTVVGHSGGWPGQITQSWVDPVDGLAVSVLTNCLDSPAAAWASEIIGLIDLALNPPADAAPVPDGIDPATFTGRFAGPWGSEDIALLGGRLVTLSSASLDPKQAVEMTVIDTHTLRSAADDGYGNVAELMHVDRRDDGTIEKVRSGATLWPIEEYRRRVAAG